MSQVTIISGSVSRENVERIRLDRDASGHLTEDENPFACCDVCVLLAFIDQNSEDG